MKIAKKQSNFIYFLTTFVFFACTNLYFSNLIVKKLSSGWTYSNNLINLIYIKNTGAAFSIMQHSTKVLIAISLIAIILMVYYILKNMETLLMKEIMFLSLLMAGIFGNLCERLAFGYVRDFFDLAFVTFPVFNISDVFINVGVFVIIILILLTKKPIKL